MLHNFILYHEQDDRKLFPDYTELKKHRVVSRDVYFVTESREMQKKIDEI